MKPEIAREWVEALVSEEFTQEKNALRSKTGHCCLGVLCELYRRANPHRAEWTPPSVAGATYKFVIDGSTAAYSVLPDEVQGWAGIRWNNGGFTDVRIGRFGFTTLAELNDLDNTFTEIAQIITDNVEGL